MDRQDCIFCRIVAGRLPAYRIYEDRRYVAILDIFPNTRGQTLVLPKRHMVSLFSDISDGELSQFVLVSKKVANLLRRKLGVARVHMVLEGLGANHLHAKLYPANGLTSSRFRQILAPETAYFKRYPGYVSTVLGPRASDASLRRLQKQITGRVGA